MFITLLRQEEDATQSQLLNGIKLEGIQSFIFSRPVALQRLENPGFSTIHL